MTSIAQILNRFHKELEPFQATLIAVSKTHPAEAIQEAYAAGQRDFGENKVQELTTKQPLLPEDIRWHLIGHLQSNKVKYVIPFVYLIHSVDSLKLLEEINKQAAKHQRRISCLLQVYIAKEESKFGLDAEEVKQLVNTGAIQQLEWIKIEGLMGMASNTENQEQVRKEFRSLKTLFEELKQLPLPSNMSMNILSMGMSGDYRMAMEEGSTMVRVGSAIFGNRY
jgi:pyridoxal phosphate enzyme (YggS family)